MLHIEWCYRAVIQPKDRYLFTSQCVTRLCLPFQCRLPSTEPCSVCKPFQHIHTEELKVCTVSWRMAAVGTHSPINAAWLPIQCTLFFLKWSHILCKQNPYWHHLPDYSYHLYTYNTSLTPPLSLFLPLFPSSSLSFSHSLPFSHFLSISLSLHQHTTSLSLPLPPLLPPSINTSPPLSLSSLTYLLSIHP